jgi:pimeloyl-ACP methyl ester carboxylesterase
MILVWLAGAVGIGALVIVAAGYAASIPLTRRRIPDPPDHPSRYGMGCEDVTFASRDGGQLGGWWIPAGELPRGTVILCPGQNGSMDKDVPQAVPLHRAGFNVLMFDFRAHGCSSGRLVTMGVLEVGDLSGALDYVISERGIERMGVLGFSMGAGVALMAAAQDDRIAALVVDGAFPRLAGILTGWGRLRGLPDVLARGLAWLTLLGGSLRVRRRLYRANPIDTAHRVTAPALFIHGEQDPFVSTEEVQSLAARLSGPTELWRVPGAGHREVFKHHPDDYNRRVIAWFEQYL